MTKIVKVRFMGSILAFDDDRVPVAHRFHNATLGLTIEVRRSDDLQTFIYGTIEQDGVTKHAGARRGHRAHSEYELYTHISSELFSLAGDLGVEDHYIWPFVEQLPVFTDRGVNVAAALALAGPIKDLLARGAPPVEVMSSLNIDADMIEFVTGTKLVLQRRLADSDNDPAFSTW